MGATKTKVLGKDIKGARPALWNEPLDMNREINAMSVIRSELWRSAKGRNEHRTRCLHEADPPLLTIVSLSASTSTRLYPETTPPQSKSRDFRCHESIVDSHETAPKCPHPQATLLLLSALRQATKRRSSCRRTRSYVWDRTNGVRAKAKLRGVELQQKALCKRVLAV